jgi:hypothetical protein
MSAEEVCWCGLGSLTVPQDYSSADIPAERCESEWLAVNLAVKPFSNQCKDAAAVVWANRGRRVL